MLQTRLTKLLGIDYPIVLAGMAGGPTTPELVAAVSNAGGLGTLGAGYLTPEQITSHVDRIRELTSRPFAINLFCPESYDVNPEEIDFMNRKLDTFRRHFGIPESPAIRKFAESFEHQLEAVLQARVPVCSFTFGVPSHDVIQRLKAVGSGVWGTATTVQEAILLEAAGIDVVVAQGSEAGGHRGTFAHTAEHALIGTMALIPQVVDHVSLPVIAAGGIMDGRGLAAALMLGAAGVQMGTAFLTCSESGANPIHKRALQTSTEEQTVITKAYSGKAARGIETHFMREMSSCDSMPPYPVQNALTRDIRQAAAKTDDKEFMSLWAGQGLRLITAQPARQMVEDTIQRALQCLQSNSTVRKD